MKRVAKASHWILGLVLMLVMMLGMSTTSWADSIELENGAEYEFGDTMVIPSDQKTYLVWDDDPNMYAENVIEPGSYLISDYEFDNGCDQWVVYLGDRENDDFLYLGAEQDLDGSEYVTGIECVEGDGSEEDPYQFKLVMDETGHDPVSYLAWDDEQNKLEEKINDEACKDYAIVDKNVRKLGKTGQTMWYVVDNNVASDYNIQVRGDVHLILKNNTSFDAYEGISVGNKASLTIYAQSTGEEAGKLIAEPDNVAGIASYSDLTVDCGNITASSENCDGIAVDGKLTINGGNVTTSSENSDGIGVDGDLTINGGSVTASSNADEHYGILCGGDIAHNGGMVTAFGENGRGIKTTGGGIVIANGMTVLAGENEKTATDVTEEYKGHYAEKLIEKWVRISKGINCTVKFRVTNGAWDDASTDEKTVELSGSEGNEPRLNADQIPAVGNKPNDNYHEGSWKRSPNTEMPITEDTVFIYNYASNVQHSHDGIAFLPWTDNDSLPTEEGNYYLNNDVLLKDMWNAPSGTVNICLNGYDIVSAGKTGTLDIGDENSDARETVAIFDHNSLEDSGRITGNNTEYSFSSFPDAVVVHDKGEFILNGGRISGNEVHEWTFYEGVVTVYDGGKFTMNGGSIDSNYTDMSCIVGVDWKNSTFTMNGGTISNNTTGDDAMIVYECYNASVFINGGTIENNKSDYSNTAVVQTGPESHFYMSGGSIINNKGTGVYGHGEKATLVLDPKEDKDIKITGNTKNFSLGGNNSHKFTFAEGSGKLSAGSRIGITTEETPTTEKVVFTEGFANRGSADKFVSDNNNYIITVTEDGELALSKIPHDVNIAGGIKNGRIEVNKDKAVAGEEVSITVTPYEGYRLRAGSLKVNNGKVPINSEDGYKFTMPDEAATISGEFEPIKVTSLRFRKTLKTIGEGEKQQIQVSIDPPDALNKTLKWTSSRPDVLTVDENGMVTGVMGGKSTVTVSTTDGSDLSRTMTIKVEHAQWSDWVETKAPTEEADGEETRTCLGCGATETRAVPRLDHTHDLSLVKGRKPTCVKSGTRDYYKCSGCTAIFADEKGETLTSLGELSIPAKGHTAGEPEKGVETPATCSSVGGYTLTTKCKDCGAVLIVERIVTPMDPNAHVWNEGEITTPPTAKNKGVKTFTCKECGTIKTESIPNDMKIKTVTVNTATVNAKAVNKAVKKAGGSEKYVTRIVLGKKVKKIKPKAFAKYKKVTTLEVKTKKLSKKSVKGSLKGSKVKTVKVKVGSKKLNKKYVKKYKKIFTKKNAGKKAKVL